MRLTLEQKELISEAMSTDAGPAILALLEGLAAEREQALLKLDSSSTDAHQLWLGKARAEGARTIVREFERRVKSLTARQDA
jgi:hypothetical protein